MFLGMAKFNEMAPKLILGERSPALLEGRVSGYETNHVTARLVTLYIYVRENKQDAHFFSLIYSN